MDNAGQYINLGWDQFEKAVDTLVQKLSDRQFSCIFGEPRGGLTLAVVLSHRLNIPFSLTPKPGMLWCDDLVDTGHALNLAQKNFPDATFCVWIARQPVSNVVFAEELPHDGRWILFPWEFKGNFLNDQIAYKQSRGL